MPAVVHACTTFATGQRAAAPFPAPLSPLPALFLRCAPILRVARNPSGGVRNDYRPAYPISACQRCARNKLSVGKSELRGNDGGNGEPSHAGIFRM